MSRKTSRFPALDSEPKSAGFRGGPPPPYHRSSGFLDDDSLAWSDSSFYSAGGLGKRRASWTNLVESDDNLRIRLSAPPSIAVANGRYAGVVNEFPLGKIPGGSRHGSCNTSSVSEFILMPSAQKLNGSSSGEPVPLTAVERGNGKKTDRMQDLRNFCAKTRNRFCILALIVLVAIAIIVAIVVTQVNFNLSWLAPSYLRNGQNSPNNIRVAVNGQQIRFDQHGSTPFTGDFISVYDFRTQKVAVIDQALKSNGRNLACFVMNLNHSSMPDISGVQAAAKNSLSRSQQNDGWQESWHYVPEPMSNVNPSMLFQPPVAECNGSRWIQLNFVLTDQKSQKCSDCYDFCLPEFGIQRDTVRAENFLNIIRRDCFYLFVPEWRTYAQAYNAEQLYYQQQRNGAGGHLNQVGNNLANPQSQSRWISLGSLPQNVVNFSSQALNTVSGAIGNAAQGLQNLLPGQNMNSYPQQGYQSNYPNYAQNGYANGINGGQYRPNGQQSWPNIGVAQGSAQNTIQNFNGANGPGMSPNWNNAPNDRQAGMVSNPLSGQPYGQVVNTQTGPLYVNGIPVGSGPGPAPFGSQPQYAVGVQPPVPDFTSLGDPVQRQVNYGSNERALLPSVFVYGGSESSTQNYPNYNNNQQQQQQQQQPNLINHPSQGVQPRQVLTAMANWPDQGFAGGGTNTPSSVYYGEHNNRLSNGQYSNAQNGLYTNNGHYVNGQPVQQGVIGRGPFVDLSEANSRKGRTLPLTQEGAWINVNS